MSEGFFSRWSQRKVAVRKGKGAEPEAESAKELDPPMPSPQPSPASGRGSEELLTVEGELQSPSPPRGEGGGEGEPPPPPTLEDAQALTPASDFTRFVRPDVAPEVKNAAFKKLFSDPHFNVMDRLDVYIDDYNKPDPLPPEMLRQLASAKFLGFFANEEAPEGENVPAASASPDAPAAESVAQSGTRTAQALPPAQDHADPDLRLQQDDAPGPEGPGAGSG
ncbi:DUF3306 domain-containing protein [Ramlibacter ginsenosidimutans]|uniref:DUF3306 domain-containing protein n=1 Tax=Ramlibacter ginsenosidimutans TaxID=502333 RepID=A0A934WPR9_9BURK|nr:DUF3306 domain-containing protein [Ramlibacter ginsenosidimutans]MBK6008630.1 DUF3306 domain-containing protein [Ramlibacter ginsenosidimutans]